MKKLILLSIIAILSFSVSASSDIDIDLGKAKTANEVRDLIELGANVNVNLRYRKGTPLYLASGANGMYRCGNAPVVHALIKAGANIEGDRENFYIPLESAVSCKHDNALDVVNVLINAGANVNAKGYHGKPIIGYAKRLDVIKALVKAGANIDSKIKVFRQLITKLFYQARYTKNLELIRFLIDAGANVNFVDSDGITITNAVKKNEYLSTSQKVQVIRWLKNKM